MVRFLLVRRTGLGPALSLAILLIAPAAALAQDAPQSVTIQTVPEKQRPDLEAAAPEARGSQHRARNLRLILKDGSYQMVRDYQVVGDRVRYLSQERDEWEELPKDLVDWDATNKWATDHADLADENASPAMKEAADLDAEESQARSDEKARMPQVAPGLELPDEDGVYVLDTFHGTPELVELKATDLSLNTKNRKGIEVLNPLASRKANLELEGANARVHLHVDDPAIYLSLGVEDETEPAALASDHGEYGRREAR